MSINNLEKALVNILTVHGYLKDSELQNFINEIKGDFSIGDQEVPFPTLFRNININLRKFSMEIKSIHLENSNNDRVTYHSLVNTEEDYVSKEFGSAFSAHELKYFGNMAIKLLEHKFLSSDDLVDLRPLDKMSRDEAQIFVQKLESNGWLRRNDSNYLILGVRTQLELRSFLESTIRDNIDIDGTEEGQTQVNTIIDEMPQIIVY